MPEFQVVIVNQGGDEVANVGALAVRSETPWQTSAVGAGPAQFVRLTKHALIITAPAKRTFFP